ncbi:MAG TPA: hypothetical protein VFQ25_00940 [Ktedonobacterales bacterium]|nr:hypothetical protein [Ktedonobacterales bacterium]
MPNIVNDISIGLFFLLPLVIVALVIVALVSGFAFGGARRNAQALLTAGLFSLLTGGFYLYGLTASYYAKQDNAYLGNIYVGLLLLLAGVWMLSVGLAGAGLAKWLAGALSVAGIVGVVPIYGSLSLSSTMGGVAVALYVVVGLAVVAVALLALRRGALLGRALALGLASTVMTLGVYGVVGVVSGRSLVAYLQPGVDQLVGHKPPTVEGFSLLACVIAGVAAYLIGRGGGGGREAPSTGAPVAPTPEQAPAG